ncbi:aminotransferase class I and II [Caldithrix abyssi DSM 13497]|uniref:Aminotransferase n=1 Tax=Caldithrix abyssi DSM 13497 TaxID=880073 RepID=H1XU37_CALAY|nr:pyridoxal phosphate-dependent aminotransferase [Caldithrix abyssi]APF16866.1 aspartate aminotransferase [Caldithrix abyssi DSM 13497]EHO40480.1 aminotransferase class I and II [Caldithrix abyssi DSM 13497]
MKILSNRGQAMPPSPIRKLAPFADQAKERGLHVYHLNIGQPDIKTPETFLQSIKNFNQPVLAYGPSAGLPSLRKKLAEYYNRFDINVTYENILVTTGGSEAIIFAMMAICDPGDEIIVPEPFYTNYNGFAVEAGVKIVPITSKIEDDFQLPPIESIAEKITDRTRGILICNPNNPTGYVYSRQELENLREIVLKHDLFLLSDEVYREFVYDGLTHTSILQLEGIEDRTIMMDSVSKRYSACGARIGMIVSKNQEVIEACLRFGQARLCPPTIEQIGTEAGIDTPQEYLDEVIAEYNERRNVMVNMLRQMPGVVAPMPKGAFYLVVKLPVDDADKFAQWLLTDFNVDNETVMIAPANGFYSTPGLGKDEVRIAYVLNVDDIKKSMNILARGLQAYPGRTI